MRGFSRILLEYEEEFLFQRPLRGILCVPLFVTHASSP